ncbi:DNA-binding response regulator (plasmid) [Thioclava litoralis]|uniref:DNA-binding response regulator n=1 Tax=Thioclava litoralis TaxID=3076557 RepID=A0ABZ1E4X4_9RHOB|nr:DNA-binding response regulator [Thioclava sp. FTW29]
MSLMPPSRAVTKHPETAMRDPSEEAPVVMVVDDDPASLMMVSEALEAAGIVAVVARDGAAALRLIDRVRPDGILLDALMPGLDGFETCKALKAAPNRIEAPVIFMTGLTEPEHILKGLKAGGVDYITKPLNLDEVLARLSIHLTNAKMLRGARSALDMTGRAVAAFHRNGQLSWSSPKATELLAENFDALFDTDGTATGELRRWLDELEDTPLSQSRRLTVDQLELAYLGAGPAQEIQLTLFDRSGPSREDLLSSRFGLTTREGEVLFWLSLGKTNTEIGNILGLSSRTVNKHLEQVFQKMGVENRTSAAVLADRAMNGN